MLRPMRMAAGIAVLGMVMGAGLPAAGQGTELSPQDVVRRDALLQPGLDALKKGDSAAALTAFQPALAAFPKDGKVLQLSGEAAMETNQNDVALGLFERALAEHPKDVWNIRFGVLRLEARLGKWEDFDKGLAELKAAKKAGDAALESPGFVVDEFEVGGQKVTAAFYPLLAGHFKTLYRFLLPVPAPVDVAASTTGGAGDRCKDPNFRPYIDVESDDVDQSFFAQAHPDLAKKGERSYSLDTYPAACSQGLIKFYSDGEPKYEVVRADVTKALVGKAKKTAP